MKLELLLKLLLKLLDLELMMKVLLLRQRPPGLRRSRVNGGRSAMTRRLINRGSFLAIDHILRTQFDL